LFVASCQLRATNQQPATSNQQPATSNQQPATRNRRAAAISMSKIESFEDLECYKVAREYRKRLAKWAKTLPKEEIYRMKDQVIRSARSITANIAEGFGRHHPQENLQFCRLSRGSLTETLDHLNAALDEELIDEKGYSEFREQWQESLRVLNGYIRYLQTLTPKDRRFSA
jgi:four helix bundle protein